MLPERMPPVFFAADVHLTGQADDPAAKAFLSFLEMVHGRGGDLYILGDLFAFWANNQRVYRRYGQVLDMLGRLAERSRVGFLQGNRDFLLQRKVLNRYGVKFLGEAYELTIAERRFFLTHGDLFCTRDQAYLRYKKSWKILRILDVIVPGFLADCLARRFRNKSIKTISRTDSELLALSDSALRKQFRRGSDYIVCGHIHRQEIRHVEEGKTLVVLPAWKQQGGYALWENGKISLSPWPK